MNIKLILDIIIYILYAISIIVGLWGVLIAVIDFLKSKFTSKNPMGVVKHNFIIKK